MYLNSKELFCEIKVSIAKGKLTKRGEKMLILLADKTINKFTYYYQEDRLDCYQQGIYSLFKNWHLFNEERSENAFAYLTEIFKRGATQGLNQLHKKKGNEKTTIRTFSLDNINDGQGIYNI